MIVIGSLPTPTSEDGPPRAEEDLDPAGMLLGGRAASSFGPSVRVPVHAGGGIYGWVTGRPTPSR